MRAPVNVTQTGGTLGDLAEELRGKGVLADLSVSVTAPLDTPLKGPVELRAVALRSALSQLLRSVGCDFCIWKDAVVIGTLAETEKLLLEHPEAYRPQEPRGR